MHMRKRLWKQIVSLVLSVTILTTSVYMPVEASPVDGTVTEETTENTVEDMTEEMGGEETEESEETTEVIPQDETLEVEGENALEELPEVEEGTEPVEEEIALESEEQIELEEKEKEEEESGTVTRILTEKDTTDFSSEESKILSEVIEEREEDSKTFLLSDGTFMVAQYGMPIHYEDTKGQWQEIDQSLEEDTSGEEYTTTEKSGKEARIKFSKKLKEGKTVSIKNTDYPLSWGMKGAENRQ